MGGAKGDSEIDLSEGVSDVEEARDVVGDFDDVATLNEETKRTKSAMKRDTRVDDGEKESTHLGMKLLSTIPTRRISPSSRVSQLNDHILPRVLLVVPQHHSERPLGSFPLLPLRQSRLGRRLHLQSLLRLGKSCLLRREVQGVENVVEDRRDRSLDRFLKIEGKVGRGWC